MANEEFQHILRIQNTNVDGKQKVMFALTAIKGIGRRFANIICKKADVDMNKRLAPFCSVVFLGFFSCCFLVNKFFPIDLGIAVLLALRLLFVYAEIIIVIMLSGIIGCCSHFL